MVKRDDANMQFSNGLARANSLVRTGDISLSIRVFMIQISSKFTARFSRTRIVSKTGGPNILIKVFMFDSPKHPSIVCARNSSLIRLV